jgi:hypothetical protein
MLVTEKDRTSRARKQVVPRRDGPWLCTSALRPVLIAFTDEAVHPASPRTKVAGGKPAVQCCGKRGKLAVVIRLTEARFRS